MENKIDKVSFILGMTTAFGECMACEAKNLALTPPMRREMAKTVAADIQKIADDMKLYLWFEENTDLDCDIVWWVIYKFESQLEGYLALRCRGLNPWTDMEAFRPLLSYGMVYGENADKVIPKMREFRNPMGVVSEILEL